MTLKENQGIPGVVLLMMAVMSGLAVANLYYNQPLLEMMQRDLGCCVIESNAITVMTQVGYVLGLLFITPMGDLYSHRRIIITTLTLSALAALAIASAENIATVWGASLVLGANSVVAQMFIPIAGQYSEPKNKARNIGYVLSGLLTGILASRVVSGAIGEMAGWRFVYASVAVQMMLCIGLMLWIMPEMKRNFEGSYTGLMRSTADIFLTHPRIRLNAIRTALSFGSMLAVWSCLSFHVAGEPFYDGADAVGALGLCGVAGAVTASGIGRYVTRWGVRRFCIIGTQLQIAAWAVAWIWGYSYAGLIVTIIVLDIGVQFMQLSNQSDSIAQLPSASNRVNTIFMTIFFIGGCLGTFLAGHGWNALGWTGICLVGILMAAASLCITLLRRE